MSKVEIKAAIFDVLVGIRQLQQREQELLNALAQVEQKERAEKENKQQAQS